MADRATVTQDTLLKFGEELLPGCRCFQRDEGGIDEAGLLFIGEAMQLGGAVMDRMGQTGVCPGAAPRMLAVLVHTAVFEVATARAMMSGEDTENPFTLVDAMELVHDEIATALRHLRNRPREIYRRAAN